MNIELRTSIVLGALSLIAFAVVIFGFARIEDSEFYDNSIAEEKQQLIEKAQLWFIRSKDRNGGGMTFEEFDFKKINTMNLVNSLEMTSRLGIYRIVERQPNYFILQSTPTSKGSAQIDTIRFDSLPHIHQEQQSSQ